MKKYSKMYLNENSNDLLGILEESLLNKIKDGVINTVKKKKTFSVFTGNIYTLIHCRYVEYNEV